MGGILDYLILDIIQNRILSTIGYYSGYDIIQNWIISEIGYYLKLKSFGYYPQLDIIHDWILSIKFFSSFFILACRSAALFRLMLGE